MDNGQKLCSEMKKVSRMSKDRCIKVIGKFSSVNVLKQHQIQSVSIEHLVTYCFGNLEVEISLEEYPHGDEVWQILSTTSFCGPYNMRNVLGKFWTVWKSKHPDLWTIDLGISVNLLQVLELQRGPLDISHECQQHELDEKVVELQHQLLEDAHTENEVVADSESLQNKSQQIWQVLLGSHSHILEEFLICLLSDSKKDKWNSVELHHLYDQFLSSTHKLFQGFTSHELDLLITTSRNHESQKCEGILCPTFHFISICAHCRKKSKCWQKIFCWVYMMTTLRLTVMFTWKEEGLRLPCFGHILRKRPSENPLSGCVFKHELGF